MLLILPVPITCVLWEIPRQSIDCHMTPSGSGINCYFNNGNVTGDIYLTFYLEDVLYYFYITDKTNDSDLRPQLSMDVDKYFIII